MSRYQLEERQTSLRIWDGPRLVFDIPLVALDERGRPRHSADAQRRCARQILERLNGAPSPRPHGKLGAMAR